MGYGSKQFCDRFFLLTRLVAFLLLIIFSVPDSSQARKRIDEERKHQVMATMVSKFLLYIEWPNLQETDSGDKKIEFCIFGKDPFKDKFQKAADLISSKAPIEISITKDLEVSEVKTCNAVYIPKGYPEKVELFSQLENLPILSITEGKEGGAGIINFVTRRKLHFVINNRQAKEKNIKIKSGLLKLAKEVIK